MALRYYKLFDTLQRRGMKKGDLLAQAKLTWPTMSKLSKGQPVNTDVIDRVCAALGCQPGDIMEHISGEQPEEQKD